MDQVADGWRKGPWTPQEDKLLIQYITDYGEGRWSSVSKCTGLKRSGKSCRLRWVNYLRPGLKKGQLTPLEEGIIIELHALWGNKWSTIARYLPGRTDNEIKNYWRTHFKTKKQQKRKLFHDQSQQQQESSETGDISEEVKNSKEEDEESDHQFWAKLYEDSAASDQFTPLDCDNNLWDGLWNMDYENDLAAVDQNQVYYDPFGGHAVGYLQNEGFLF